MATEFLSIPVAYLKISSHPPDFKEHAEIFRDQLGRVLNTFPGLELPDPFKQRPAQEPEPITWGPGGSNMPDGTPAFQTFSKSFFFLFLLLLSRSMSI